jgi:N-acetyl-anhydromuramyl-L-alanine amidase AmpD
LLDFSAALIDPQAIKAAGFDGVIGYFSESRPGANFGAKPLRRDYCDQLRTAGLEVVSCYQYGKGVTSDWFGGYDGGVFHAEIAVRHHLEAGGPQDRPIYAPVDANPTLRQWDTYIAPFLRGWSSVVGVERTGMYGNAHCIDWALEDDVAQWFWQHNWSGDSSINSDHPAAHLHQIEIDQRMVGGVGVDVSTTLKPDYGQWSTGSTGAPVKPNFSEKDQTGISPNCDSRGGAVPRWFLLHTQEGDGTAQSLAAYLQNPNSQVSYHYTVDNGGDVVDVVDTDLESWSVLDANPKAINLCFAGSRAAWSRQEWLDNMSDAIDIAAYLAVQDCLKYGIPTHIISPADLGNGLPGIADHRAVTIGLGIGTHTDVGDGFPWDVFTTAVAKYSGSSPSNGGPMALTDDEQRELLEKTRDIWTQLRGPDGNGWPQLGQNTQGQNLTLVDKLATLTHCEVGEQK